MSLISAIPIIGKLLDSTADIVKEVVVDKDKQNEIIGNIEQIRQNVYVIELQTKTVPWVDALHKMGRQLTNWFLIALTLVFEVMGWELDQNVVLLAGGGNMIYQLIKGKGK